MPDKLGYVQGKRPKVDCILCASLERKEGVECLIVHETDLFFLTLNLYPYNPGHLMIVPKRHTETIEDFSDAEVLQWFDLQKKCFTVLREMYNPKGFNTGFNIGECSGASIAHIHYHVVPRYHRELGFMDIINQSRIIVESPVQTIERMRDAFSRLKAIR